MMFKITHKKFPENTISAFLLTFTSMFTLFLSLFVNFAFAIKISPTVTGFKN